MHVTESSEQIPFALIATVPASKLSCSNGKIAFSSCHDPIICRITLTYAMLCWFIRVFKLHLTLSVCSEWFSLRFGRIFGEFLGLAGDIEEFGLCLRSSLRDGSGIPHVHLS